MVMIGFTVPNAKENIIHGSKVTTIRRKNPRKEEQMKRIGRLDLYENPRTLNMELIGRYKLRSLTPFKFSEYLEPIQCGSKKHLKILGDIAFKDGFVDASEMIDWFSSHYDDWYHADFTIIMWYSVPMIEE